MTLGCSRVPAEISLTELQKSLDAQGIEVVNNQKESLVGRKALADKTRGIQSSDSSSPLIEYTQNLRSCQTRRS